MHRGEEDLAVILKVIIDDQTYEINVPAVVLAEARDYFDQIDRDLDVGWQMGRDWVEAPDRIQRAQIVADRLLTALETDNRKLGTLLAGYLLDRLPGLESVEPDLRASPRTRALRWGAHPRRHLRPRPSRPSRLARA